MDTDTLTNCEELALVLAQCRITSTIDLLVIDCPRQLCRSLDIGLLTPCRLEVLRVEFWRDGEFWFGAGIEFWIGDRITA